MDFIYFICYNNLYYLINIFMVIILKMYKYLLYIYYLVINIINHKKNYYFIIYLK